MSTQRKPGSATLALAMALLAAPLLTGCFANPLEGIIEGATDRIAEEAGEGIIEEITGGDVSLGGSLPEGFPTEIPLIDAEIVFAVGVPVDNGTGYSVNMQTTNAAHGDEMIAKLKADSFTTVHESEDDRIGAGGVYENDKWSVITSFVDNGDGTFMAGYIIAPKE